MSDQSTPRNEDQDLPWEALVLIDDQPDAQRLVVSWKKACELTENEATPVMVDGHLGERGGEIWAELAKVTPLEVDEWFPVLYGNGFIEYEEGNPWVSKTAIGFVGAMMMERASRARRR